MKRKIISVLSLLLLIAAGTQAQSLSPGTLATQGLSSSEAGIQLQSTIGPAFITTLSKGSGILTQGFQQPELQLRTGRISSTLCAGSIATIPFAASGIFSPANQFTAELSDASGSFSNPVAIGRLKGNANGVILASIPASAIAGTNYRVRVRSSIPVFYAPENNEAISIHSLRGNIRAVNALNKGVQPFTLYDGYAPGAALTLKAEILSGKPPFMYHWSTGSADSVTVVNTVFATANRKVSVTITDALGCSTSLQQQINIVDVRCGDDLLNVKVCLPYYGFYINNCIPSAFVKPFLEAAGLLGACQVNAATSHPGVTESNSAASSGLSVNIYPNPSPSAFTLAFKSISRSELRVRVTDALGRVVETRLHANPGELMKLGDGYKPGIYFLEVIQGNEKIAFKLVKQSD